MKLASSCCYQWASRIFIEALGLRGVFGEPPSTLRYTACLFFYPGLKIPFSTKYGTVPGVGVLGLLQSKHDAYHSKGKPVLLRHDTNLRTLNIKVDHENNSKEKSKRKLPIPTSMFLCCASRLFLVDILSLDAL